VDLIMAGVDPSTISPDALIKAGGALIARDITFIKDSLGKCKCSGKEGSNEPYVHSAISRCICNALVLTSTNAATHCTLT
jgi:hypothetical protein